MATDIYAKFKKADIPDDESPELDPAYTLPGDVPDPDAPYGRKADGTPYKRRPNGTRKSGSGNAKRMPASESLARSAAGLLATANKVIGVGFLTAGFPNTAMQITANNDQFEELAYQALLTDPALCKKILGAGATSGKAGLVIAYSMLIGTTIPTARNEIHEKRKSRELENADA